jgi:hypothetical protein
MMLLIGAPIISYYYLKGGYNYRVALISELKIKGEVRPFNFVKDSALVLRSDDLKGNVTIMSYVERGGDNEYLRKLQDQFHERTEFHMWSFVPGEVEDTGFVNWKMVSTTREAINQLLINAISDTLELKAPIHVLIDTSGMVRHIYQGGDVETQKKMVEHITVILPRSKESDIIYKPTADE